MFKINDKNTRTQLTFTCSKLLTIETLEKGVKYF